MKRPKMQINGPRNERFGIDIHPEFLYLGARCVVKFPCSAEREQRVLEHRFPMRDGVDCWLLGLSKAFLLYFRFGL
jgi:hypothetical protein